MSLSLKKLSSATHQIKMTNFRKGFTLIELTVYIVITVILLSTISGLALNILHVRSHIRAEDLVQQNARFIFNFLSDNIHQASSIEDVSPDPAQLKFYLTGSGDWFTITPNSTRLEFQTEDAAVTEVIHDSNVHVNSFILTPIAEEITGTIRGVQINMELETGEVANSYRHAQQTYKAFFSLR